jgi:hypothetical protein
MRTQLLLLGENMSPFPRSSSSRSQRAARNRILQSWIWHTIRRTRLLAIHFRLRQAPISAPGLCRSAGILQDTAQGRSLATRMQKKHVLIFSLVSATALLGLVLLHGDHASEEDELIARRNIFGFNDYAPNAYTRPGGGAYMYSPPRIFAAPATGRAILTGVPRHTIGVMVPLKDLDKLEDVQEEDSHEIEVLRKEQRDLKEEDRKTLEKTGNQLGALMRKMTALIRTNVMLR